MPDDARPPEPRTAADAPWDPSRRTGGVLRFAHRVLADAAPARGRLLDIPCGTGLLAGLAAESGFDVVPCDLYPEFWEGDPAVVPVRCDFNDPLPFEDDSFDAVAHCEGIEHVENPWQMLRELRRVLRPDGALVLSFPNTVDVRQRLRLLRRGYVGHYIPRVPEHVNRMGTFYLCHALLRTGWTIESIRVRETYGGPFHRLLARFMGFDARCGLPEDVRAMLSNNDVLRARTVFVTARPA